MFLILWLYTFLEIHASPQDFISEWQKSQVFIYEKPVYSKPMKSIFDWRDLYPNCFGNLLTNKYVITSVSCIFDVTKLIETNDNVEESLKFNPENAIVALVIFRLLRFLKLLIFFCIIYYELGRGTGIT